ncbi:hypothetical protein [Salidesulfovibrio brasiliensis]|uniref:hypothetical protein n=1 Tax=Salidesulfovibrio brasiliensis TaxID=221711 RepID=UPI000ADA245A|nr:hypothetical protein [Salidesulfovibrio brasiliensis]
MKCVAEWIVPSRVRNVALITAGLEAFCGMNGFSERDSRQLQVAVEGVFAYCARTLSGNGEYTCIRCKLFWEDRRITVELEYSGKGGELDEMLRPDKNRPVRRTSFEAMGVFIARELLESLVCISRYDLALGGRLNTYTLTYSLGADEGASVAGADHA